MVARKLARSRCPIVTSCYMWKEEHDTHEGCERKALHHHRVVGVLEAFTLDCVTKTRSPFGWDGMEGRGGKMEQKCSSSSRGSRRPDPHG